MTDPPCPDRPQVPPEPKPWTGLVEAIAIFRVLVNDFDDVTTDEGAREHVKQVVIECIQEDPDYVDYDILKTEAFRDGE